MIKALKVDVSIEPRLKRQFDIKLSDYKKTLKKILNQALLSKPPCNIVEAETLRLSVLLTDDSSIRRLNCEYRKKDKATDVLSFPSLQEDLGEKEWFLGDLVISLETTLSQATALRVSFADELLRLSIHGTLHLFGYDHENVPRKEATRMRKVEERIFACVSETK